MNKVIVRPESAGDYENILKLTHDAFLTLDYPGRMRQDEHYLIHLMYENESGCIIRDLSFVAELNGEIVGHIVFAKSEVERDDRTAVETITFGPLSVLPKYHKQGIGKALVLYSIKKARELGYGAIIIEGVPEYYPKLGFLRGRELGLCFEDGTSPDTLMVFELSPGYLNGCGVVTFLCKEYEICEKDDEGFKIFHRDFMSKYFPAEVFLRPFWGDDILLMEKWLFLPHVAEWYKYPEHWLNEVRNRKGEFSFLNHFIVEYEGVPIGFCHYYDCIYSQTHEIWNDKWHLPDEEGIAYSIDVLIGEPDYIHRGIGKEIIRLLTDKIKNLGAKRIIAEPEADNIATKRALEANGYKYSLSEECYYMEFTKETSEDSNLY